jgi:hypothetical protein
VIAVFRQILFICFLLLFISCEKEEPQRVRLLEFEIDSQFVSYEGYALCYNDIKNEKSIGYDWHIYNTSQNALYIQVYDSTFTREVFAYPAFQAKYTIELTGGQSKNYQATDGQFRLLGPKEGDATGDFHFKMKNIANPSDSIMIENGYFRIWLEKYDRKFNR